MLVYALLRLWERLRAMAGAAALAGLLIGSVLLMRYEDPPGLPWSSLVGMIAFPLGSLGLALSLGIGIWMIVRHVRR